MTLRDRLKEEVLVVTFTKKDGSERRMVCTLQQDFLPEATGTSSGGYEGITAVYDVEADGWRSFRDDSVIKVETLDGVEIPA